jgi:hypothetical protein
VLFLEYYNAAKVIFHIPPFGVATAYHLTPQYLAFGIVLLCGFYIVPVVLSKPIPARRMAKLRRLIQTPQFRPHPTPRGPGFPQVGRARKIET